MVTLQVGIAFAFGVAFVVALLVVAIKFPHPTPFQYNVFRSVFALAGAGVAAMIPGFLNVDLNSTSGLLIRSGGALAVFVVLFFFNPARLRVQTTDREEAPPILERLPTGEAVTPTRRNQFVSVWRALIALDKAAEALWQRISDQTLAAFADRRREAEDVVNDGALFFSEPDYDRLQEILRAADFYFGGKDSINAISGGVYYSDAIIDLARPGEPDSFINEYMKRQIQQNKRWLTRYRNLLQQLRSSFHKTVISQEKHSELRAP